MVAQNRIRECTNGVELPTFREVQDQAQAAFEEYPLGVTLAVFGIGLGVGVAVGMSLAESLVGSPRSAPESMTQQAWEALVRVLPDAVTRQIRV